MSKLIKICLLGLLLISVSFFVPSNIRAQTPQPNINQNQNQVVIPNSNYSNINDLEKKVDSYRNENYQKAIKVAEEAGNKADKLIDWLIKIAALLGLMIVLAAVITGWDWKRLEGSLRKHVASAKENAATVAKIASRAIEKEKLLQKEIGEFMKLKKELDGAKTSSKNDIVKLREKIDEGLQKIEKTISEIESLRNSANFISNATVYPSAAGSPNVVSAVGTDLSSYFSTPIGSASVPLATNLVTSTERCMKCGKNKNPLTDFGPINLTDEYVAGGRICNECKQRGL